MSLRSMLAAGTVAAALALAATAAAAQTSFGSPYAAARPGGGQAYPPASYIQPYYGSPYSPQAAASFTAQQPVHQEPQGEMLLVSGSGTYAVSQNGAVVAPVRSAPATAASPAPAPAAPAPAVPASAESAPAAPAPVIADPAPGSAAGTTQLPPQTFQQLYEARAEGPEEAEFEPDPHKGYGGWLSELRFGILEHDAGVWSGKKEDGLDINGEVLFVSPDFLDIIFSPRPTIGGSIHTEGETNVLYFGLTWEWNITPWMYLEAQWGPAFHDGNLTGQTGDKKGYGCPVLSRGSLALGFRFYEHHSIQAFYSHMSNGDLCDENDGIDAAGIRYGYRF